MFDTKIQTPVSSKVLVKAKKKAEKSGFSSINDVIRIILNQYAEGKIDFNVSISSFGQNIPLVSDDEQKELTKFLHKIKENNNDEIVESDIITL